MFSSYKQFNPYLLKFANKNKGTTPSREVPITEQMAHYTSMPELTAIIFYQRNCIDLKPFPIIRFVFQLGFQIVLD